MDTVKITIIGAGVIGLAIASELSAKFDDIIVLEKNDSFGQETSSRNSEVIHAGIYYPDASLKLRLCLEGSRYLYELSERVCIPYKAVGKIIIITDSSEYEALELLYKRAKAHGLEELSLLNKQEIQRIEPHTNAVAGIYSPRTGIIDSHSLMKFFVNNAKSKGVDIVYRSEVNQIFKHPEGFVLGLKDDQYHFLSKIVINAAGLYADQVAALSGIDIDKSGYKLKFCKGDYFYYIKPSPVSRLIYPLPSEHYVGLGIHATLDLGSRLKFGPDHEYVDAINYDVDPKKSDTFFKSVKRMIPSIQKEAIFPDMSGIRPKLQGYGEPFKDFIIREESGCGLVGLINLVGIESPGLTSCIAIAKMVAEMVKEVLN